VFAQRVCLLFWGNSKKWTRLFAKRSRPPRRSLSGLRRTGSCAPLQLAAGISFVPHTRNPHKRLISAPGKRIFSPDQRKKSLFFSLSQWKKLFCSARPIAADQNARGEKRIWRQCPRAGFPCRRFFSPSEEDVSNLTRQFIHFWRGLRAET
jgi:hypothetical protein